MLRLYTNTPKMISRSVQFILVYLRVPNLISMSIMDITVFHIPIMCNIEPVCDTRMLLEYAPQEHSDCSRNDSTESYVWKSEDQNFLTHCFL
jgi:hypothetical protein